MKRACWLLGVVQQKPETRGRDRQTDPDLMELVWLHTALVFVEGRDKGKGLHNLLSADEHNCGWVVWEVLVSSFAVRFNFKHRYGLNLVLTTQ